ADRARRLRLALVGTGQHLTQILDLVAGAHHVGVFVGVGQAQLVQLRLQFRELALVHAAGGLYRADLRFTGKLGLQRRRLRALLHQVHARRLDLVAQLADAGVGIRLAAWARIG